MFEKYENQKHQDQAEEFILELGKFVLAFEQVCDIMRYNIMFILRSQGLTNQGMEQVVIGDKAAAELQTLLGALFCEIPTQDEDDKESVKNLLKRIKDISQERNILLHCSWNLGDKAADAELYAATVRYRTKQNSGADAEIHGYSASYVQKKRHELKKIQILLARLQCCITQKNFKVSVELGKSM